MILFVFRLEELQVLDIKFLYGCSKPTIVVLYQVSNSILSVRITGNALSITCLNTLFTIG